MEMICEFLLCVGKPLSFSFSQQKIFLLKKDILPTQNKTGYKNAEYVLFLVGVKSCLLLGYTSSLTCETIFPSWQ